jgi:glycosyltransferase involved in cell wall biosynthesis
LFLIAGDGPLRADVEKLASELNVSERLRFLGIRKDIPELMAAADGYVMSSAWEGLPMVLLEAAASGLPIVATNVGGNGEVVRDGISGHLVPPSDPVALASALQQAEQFPASVRTAMGSAGRDFVIKNYSLSSVLDLWESIYQSFMHKQAQLVYAQGSAS